jgi:hypothetical protein
MLCLVNAFYAISAGVATIPLALHVPDMSSFVSYALYFAIGIVPIVH